MVDVEAMLRPRRDVWRATARGLRKRCPACGEGRLLRGYLVVNDACPACGEELHHHRADDAPSWVTILLVGHVVGVAMFAADDLWPDLPLAVHYATWPLLCVGLCLGILPIAKSGIVAVQWALRMHGFETAHTRLPASARAAREPIRVPQKTAA